MRDLSLEARGQEVGHEGARKGPELRIDIVADCNVVLDLRPDGGDEGEFRFSAAVGLGFRVRFGVDFVLELRRDGGSLQDTVLAVEQVGVQGEFADGEGDDEGFPGDCGAVEPGAEAVEEVHLEDELSCKRVSCERNGIVTCELRGATLLIRYTRSFAGKDDLSCLPEACRSGGRSGTSDLFAPAKLFSDIDNDILSLPVADCLTLRHTIKTATAFGGYRVLHREQIFLLQTASRCPSTSGRIRIS